MVQDFYKQGGSYFTTGGRKVANPTELQNLAKAGGKEIAMPSVPTGATKIASPDQLKGLTEQDIFRQGQDIYRLPSINTTLDAEQVSPDVPEPEAVNDVSSYTAGIDTTIKGLEENIKKINEPLPQEQEISEIRKRQGELSEQKAQVQETALPKAEEFGYTKYTKELQSILPQIASLKAQYDNAEIAQEGRIGSASSIYGRQALIQRQRAIELQGLSAIAQAYQGNIQLATQTAQNMVEMELAPIQTRIDDQKWQIEQVYEQLTSAEQKKADSLNLVLAERERLLEEEKERKMNIANIGLVAAQNGADQATIEKIMNATDYMKAIKLAVPYLRDRLPVSEQMKLLEGGYILNADGNVTVDYGHDPITGAITDPSKVIRGYNFTSYATDSKWGDSINSILNEQMPNITSVESLANYITDFYRRAKVGNSSQALKVAQAIWESSAQNGIDVNVLAAIAQHESRFSTSNVAMNNNNPGGVTWNTNFPPEMKGTARPSKEGGNYVKYGTLTEGFNAVARNIARRKQEETMISDYIVESLTPEQNVRLDKLALEPRQKEIAAGIVAGTQPPIMTIQRTPEITGILGGLQALGYDNTKAVADYTAMMNTVKNMTGEKVMSLRRSLINLEGGISQAERIYADWVKTGLPGGYSDYNKAALIAASKLPGEAGVAARTLISHIEDMAADLAVVYRGGGQATDDALAQAQKSLSSDWNQEQFMRNLRLIQENLQIRKNSINFATEDALSGNIYGSVPNTQQGTSSINNTTWTSPSGTNYNLPY